MVSRKHYMWNYWKQHQSIREANSLGAYKHRKVLYHNPISLGFTRNLLYRQRSGQVHRMAKDYFGFRCDLEYFGNDKDFPGAF